MSIDFSGLMLDPIYNSIGVEASLTLVDSRQFDLTVLDETGGVTTGNKIEVPTAKPSAGIRYSELLSLGLTSDDIIRGQLTFNGMTWIIRNRELDPNPNGVRAGEVIALLSDPNEFP